MKICQTTTPDFDVTVKLRNNHLVSYRESLGLNAEDFAKACGVSYTTYLQLESMSLPPTRSRGDGWRESALKVAEFMKADPESIWPDAVLRIKNSKVNLKISVDQIEGAFPHLFNEHRLPPHPEEYIAQQDLEDIVKTAIMGLKPAERQTMVLLHGLDGEGERSPADVSISLGVTYDEVLKLEKAALKKLRKRSTSEDLLAALNGGGSRWGEKARRADAGTRDLHEERAYCKAKTKILQAFKVLNQWLSVDDLLEEFEPGTFTEAQVLEFLEIFLREGSIQKREFPVGEYQHIFQYKWFPREDS